MRGSQAGFTLLELLVSIAIIGVLAGGAVVAVSTVRSSASAATCSADADTIQTAQDASWALRGGYAEEDELVEHGHLKEPSTLHDVVLNGSSFELVPLGDCVATTSEVAAEDAEADDPAHDKEAAEAAAKAEEAKKAEEAERAKEVEAAEAAEREAAELKAKEETSSGKCAKGQINLNTADEKELAQIDRLVEVRRSRVMRRRPFESYQQMVDARVISEEDLKGILEQGLACLD